MIKDYYIQELEALRSDAQRFAENFPNLAPYLNTDSFDPDVERLLEGFAYLSAKLNMQIEQELPELSHSLVELMWPNYLRPIPSSTIIQFRPINKNASKIHVPRNTLVFSKETMERPKCTFSLVYDVNVMPLELSNVEYIKQGETGSVDIQFGMTAPGSLSELDRNSKLRVFLGGTQHPKEYTLFLFLSRYIEKITLEVIIDENKKTKLNLPIECIQGVGFGEGEHMLPVQQNVFLGYQLIQEYFCFPAKFMYFDFDILRHLSEIDSEVLSQAREFLLQIDFLKSIPTQLQPSRENFKLYCSPAINIYSAEAAPIALDANRDEYLVKVEGSQNNKEVYDVDAVNGWVAKDNTYGRYKPFIIFDSTTDELNPGIYYSKRLKIGQDNLRTLTYLRFSTPNGYNYVPNRKETTVSLQIKATDGQAAASIRKGEISLHSESMDSSLEFTNIVACSQNYPPPIKKEFLWKTVSYMTVNYLTLKNIETMKKILMHFDFYGNYDEVKRIQNLNSIYNGLITIKNYPLVRFWKGAQLRGLKSTLQIDTRKFSSIGEAYLLSCVLNEFFALYCNINSFHQLELVTENNEIFKWEPRSGKQELF